MLNQEDKGVAEKIAMHIADVTDMIDFVEKSDVSCKISFIMSLLVSLWRRVMSNARFFSLGQN